VHPRKEEVLLLHPNIVGSAIEKTVSQSLNMHVAKRLTGSHQVSHTNSQAHMFGHVAHTPSVRPLSHSSYMSDSSWGKSRTEMSDQWVPESFTGTSVSHETEFAKESLSPSSISLSQVSEQSGSTLSSMRTLLEKPSYTLLGIFHATYILIETDAGLLMIDQHAAHERILYDELQQAAGEALATTLLFPEIVPLYPDDYERIVPYLVTIGEVGIIAEPWSEYQIKVTATPPALVKLSIQEFFIELVKIIHKTEKLDATIITEKLHHELRAMIACKAAIKAGDLLQAHELTKLIEKYLLTPNRMTCPHGRPTSWLLRVADIERMFKRIA
jgi:DNA mismatch repair ATPase MutL